MWSEQDFDLGCQKDKVEARIQATTGFRNLLNTPEYGFWAAFKPAWKPAAGLNLFFTAWFEIHTISQAIVKPDIQIYIAYIQ